MSTNMEPAGKKDENIENKRRRLIFRSDHRGTKEMDLILGSFARANVPKFTECELVEYDELLCNNDPDLYNWITKKEAPPKEIASMSAFTKLLEHKFV
ncbi:MAG: succinate dehydrogenase assembly factor 2 [Alphaproteobacteria bacterium]